MKIWTIVITQVNSNFMSKITSQLLQRPGVRTKWRMDWATRFISRIRFCKRMAELLCEALLRQSVLPPCDPEHLGEHVNHTQATD